VAAHLLDTQLVLWVALAPERLAARTRRLVQAREQPVAFSDASLWEVAMKSSLGRPDFSVDARALRDGMLAAGFEEWPIRAEHLFEVGRLAWHHRDPFDRLLVAQAAVEKATLLTADATLKAYGRHVRLG
jgi:PIN domain nuclease of toxin-antitoxin system